MSKHTPGPWKYIGRVSISGGIEWPTVECSFKRFIQPEGRDQDECEANARLIAAAPDMLELITNLSGAYEGSDEQRSNELWNEWNYKYWHLANAAKALLAKIEGGKE